MKAISILVPLVSAVYVSAHGILTGFTANGRDFRDAIRPVSSQDPNRGAENPALNCGPNARPAKSVAEVSPGATMTFDWRTANGQPWPHNTGPMMTYLANCGAGSCAEFDASRAEWFKIHEVGKKPNSGEWFQQDLMNGASATVKLPDNLAPGNYLVRHEVLALHLASQIRMAEFYPGCAQLRVGGSGTGRPAQADLTPFPGGYNDNDKGIFGNNFFGADEYDFPGPNVSNLSGGGGAPAPAPAPSPSPAPAGNGNTGNGNTGSGNTSSGGTPTGNAPSQTSPAAIPAQPGKSGSCKLKKRSPVDADDEPTTFKPRHLSRVMRRLAFDVSH